MNRKDAILSMHQVLIKRRDALRKAGRLSKQNIDKEKKE